MKIRFQADADLNEDIVLSLTRLEPGVDFQTATEAGLRGLGDPEVLSHAAQAGRILVTRQANDAKALCRFILNNTSPGVFIIGQYVSVRAAIDELSLIWNCSDGDEWINCSWIFLSETPE
jgi:uncharacterized protein DUF5615